MGNFFIDCGGNNGCSVIKFRKIYDPKEEYKIFSFEGNPKFFDCYKNFKNHELIKKLAWIEDATIDFYIQKTPKSSGSTIFEFKTNAQKWDDVIKIKAECIDFSRWLKNNFTLNDEIILKMDIEGAEYEVLSKMLKEETIKLINKLFVEWHWKKINYPFDKHKNLLLQLKQYIPTIQKWQAL